MLGLHTKKKKERNDIQSNLQSTRINVDQHVYKRRVDTNFCTRLWIQISCIQNCAGFRYLNNQIFHQIRIQLVNGPRMVSEWQAWLIIICWMAPSLSRQLSDLAAAERYELVVQQIIPLFSAVSNWSLQCNTPSSSSQHLQLLCLLHIWH